MKVFHDMLLPRSGAGAIPCSARGNRRNLGQRLAAQSLGLDREPAPLVVREPETLAPKLGSEHTVLLLLVVDHILLLAVDPVLCQNSALLK